jgi:hypothetical protein
MTKTRKQQERDQWDDLPDKIDFKGLTPDEVLVRGGLLKQLTGWVLQKAIYSFGMRNRDIKSRLEQVYNVEASPELISRVKVAMMEETCGSGRAGRWKSPTLSCIWTHCG